MGSMTTPRDPAKLPAHLAAPAQHQESKVVVEEELDEASVWDYATTETKGDGPAAQDATTTSPSGVAPPASDDFVLKERVGGKRSAVRGRAGSDNAAEKLIKYQPGEMRGGSGIGSIPIQSKRNPYDLAAAGDLDGDEAGITMGTSAPINIPLSVRRITIESPHGEKRAQSFVPPHLISQVAPAFDVDVGDSDLSSSVMKRDQLKHRNSVLKQTGFLEPAALG